MQHKQPLKIFIVYAREDGGCKTDRDSDCEKNEKPAHVVALASFSIGKYEVTQADWREIMGNSPSDHKNCDECPVEQVSWDEIQDFLKNSPDFNPAMHEFLIDPKGVIYVTDENNEAIDLETIIASPSCPGSD